MKRVEMYCPKLTGRRSKIIGLGILYSGIAAVSEAARFVENLLNVNKN